jgi:hypothetical protein
MLSGEYALSSKAEMQRSRPLRQNGWMATSVSTSSFRLIFCVLLFCSLYPVHVRAQVDVLTQHNDNARTGANLRETVLTPENVNQARFGMLFKRIVDDQLYTQPLVVTGVEVGGGTHDVVYVTTVNNSVYAFDANDAEARSPLWHVNFGTPANVHSTNFGCLDINGQMGIIGTPVIDKARGVLYVVALTRAGAVTGPHTGFIQRLHELDLATGADLPESPITIQAEGFNALMENQRPALMLANGMVYVGYASHCDKEPYHGYLMAYDAKTLRQIGVFNSSPTGTEASFWQSGQGPAADAEGNVYAVTGNGRWDGVRHFLLDEKDNDLDSSGATLIPGTHLVMGGGKEGVLYTLDTRKLGHLGDEHAVQHFQATASHLHSLVYWESDKAGHLLYVWGQRDRAKVYKLEGEKLIALGERRQRRNPVGGDPCYGGFLARIASRRAACLRCQRHSPRTLELAGEPCARRLRGVLEDGAADHRQREGLPRELRHGEYRHGADVRVRTAPCAECIRAGCSRQW